MADAGGLSARLIGASAVLRLEREVERAVAEEGFGPILEQIVHSTHRQGKAASVDGAWIWENVSDVESMRIRLIPGDGVTRIEIKARYGAMAAFIYFAVFFCGIFLTAAFGGFALGIRTLVGGLLIAPVGLILSYLIARRSWRAFSRRRESELADLLDDLERLIGE